MEIHPTTLSIWCRWNTCFSLNYDLKYLNLKLPTFYKDIISHWQELNKVVPTTKKDVLDQIVWNNRFITINKASVYFRNWHHAGIHKLSCLLDDYNNQFLSFNEFSQKFKVQYHGLLSAIPRIYLKSICLRGKQFTYRMWFRYPRYPRASENILLTLSRD